MMVCKKMRVITLNSVNDDVNDDVNIYVNDNVNNYARMTMQRHEKPESKQKVEKENEKRKK